jgi:hypothetical protein
MDGESLPHFPNELYVVSAVVTSMRETVLPSATSSADHSASHRLLWQATARRRKFGVSACQNNRGEQP